MERRDFLAAGVALPGAVRALGRSGEAPPSPTPGSVTDPVFDALVSLTEELMRRHGIPGAALGVVRGGELQMRALGVTSVEDPRPVTPDTIFELASLSKTVTAAAVMALVQEGRLELDAPLRTVLPGFRVADEEASARVTLRHLLTHSPGWEARYSVDDGEGALGRWAATTGDLAQLAPPGRVWSYNNTGFGLLGRVVELATGRDVRDALADLVFEPLGLDRASAHITEIVTWPVALGHRPGPGGAARVVRPYSMGSSVPAGGVNMSLASLMRFVGFFLGEHDGGGAGALSRESRAEMLRPWLDKEPTTEQVGLGFHLRTLGGVLTAAHGGTAGAGHRCHMQLVPERRLGFAILTNHTEGWRLLQAVEREALRAYEGLALAPGQPICGYRGHTETADHASALPVQPPAAEYAGSYTRGGGRATEVRAALGGGLLVGNDDARVLFYGPDVAFADAVDRIHHEFVREEGRVRWMRVNGQVAAREG